MASPLVPASLISHNAVASSKGSSVKIENVGGNEQLSITLELSGAPTMRVTNNSSSMTILKRINPGVVVVGDTRYDLNHSLYNSAHGFRADESRTFAIKEVVAGMAQPRFSAQYANKPRLKHQRSKQILKIADVALGGSNGLALNTSKVFFS